MTSDPNSYIQASAQTLAETLASKNSDYAPTGEFSNFEKAAEVAGVGVLQVMVAQTAIKMTRIESLMGTQGNPRVVGESLKDSLLDLAGYATIAHAYLEYKGKGDEPAVKPESPCPHRDWERIGADWYRCGWCESTCAAEAFND